MIQSDDGFFGGFIYEPSDFKRHYQNIHIHATKIVQSFSKIEELSMEDVKEWISILREMNLIQEMKYTHYLPEQLIHQLNSIVRSIYDRKKITEIDYILVYYRIQMILFFVSKIHFL